MLKKVFKKIKERIKNPPQHKCRWNDPLCLTKPRLFGCICGKGETTVQAAPTTPAPSATESAADIYKARLQYDPQMAALEMQQQQTYMPQQAALYQALYNQYMPQMAQAQQQMQRQLYPQQAQILEAGARNVLAGLPSAQLLSQGTTQQALTQLQSPQSALAKAMETEALAGLQPLALTGTVEEQALAGLQPLALTGTVEEQALAGLTPSALQTAIEQQAMAGLTPTGLSAEQQVAIDAIRQRQATGLSRQLRERANLGGTLYGGRSQQLESQGLQELAQRYSAEDLDRLLANRQTAMQQALSIQSAGEAQRQAALQNLMSAAQLRPGLNQAALQNLMSAAQLRPGLRQQALSGVQATAGLQTQNLQQAIQNAMALQQTQQQAAIPYMQILYPQVGTQAPNIQPYQYQSAVPSADTLYGAMFQASQPELYTSQQYNPWSDIMKLGGTLGGATIMASSIRYKKNIELWE